MRKTTRKGSRTRHTVRGGRLNQLDLPVWPASLTAVRVVEANFPRITGPDWLIIHGPVTFSVELPIGLVPGAVVEWDERPDSFWPDYWYTTVTFIRETSITFRHAGRGPDGALEAARFGSYIKNGGQAMTPAAASTEASL